MRRPLVAMGHQQRVPGTVLAAERVAAKDSAPLTEHLLASWVDHLPLENFYAPAAVVCHQLVEPCPARARLSHDELGAHASRRSDSGAAKARRCGFRRGPTTRRRPTCSKPPAVSSRARGRLWTAHRGRRNPATSVHIEAIAQPLGQSDDVIGRRRCPRARMVAGRAGANARTRPPHCRRLEQSCAMVPNVGILYWRAASRPRAWQRPRDNWCARPAGAALVL